MDQETLEELALRVQREQRAAIFQRESFLASRCAFRVGSVPYLNAVPLTRGVEDQMYIRHAIEMPLMRKRMSWMRPWLSVTEVLFSDRYDVLDGIAIACWRGQECRVGSSPTVIRVREVFCDTHRSPVFSCCASYWLNAYSGPNSNPCQLMIL